jgi:hypothetical protein
MKNPDPRLFEPAQLLETFWHRLVNRKYAGAPLKKSEEEFYDLSIVMGELYGEGLAGYFSSHFQDYDRHQRLLEAHGFSDVAEGLRRIRALIFGDAPLTQDVVEEGIDRYFEGDEAGDDPRVNEANKILDHLQDRCTDIGEYRNQLGLREGFYERLD